MIFTVNGSLGTVISVLFEALAHVSLLKRRKRKKKKKGDRKPIGKSMVALISGSDIAMATLFLYTFTLL